MNATTEPLTDEFDPEPGDPLPAPVLRLFEAIGDFAARRITDGFDNPFPSRPTRSSGVEALLRRVRRLGEVDCLYRLWIAKEVTLGYVQLTADLSDEEADILYRGRDAAMRIDRLGRVTYDEPTLLRAVNAVVGRED